MPSKKKKYNARFPPARIKKIMQTDEEVGKVAAAVPVIISRALELFVESLLQKASVVTAARQARTLSTFHLKQCILSETKFDFLKELVEAIPDRPDSVPEDDPVLYENPPPVSEKPKKKRGRKPKSESMDNAGPSCSASESGEDDEDDENSGSSEEQEILNVEESNSSTIVHNDVEQNESQSASDSYSQNSNSSHVGVAHNSAYGTAIPSAQVGMEDDDYDA